MRFERRRAIVDRCRLLRDHNLETDGAARAAKLIAELI
jgi:hypothetical protein